MDVQGRLALTNEISAIMVTPILQILITAVPLHQRQLHNTGLELSMSGKGLPHSNAQS